LARLIAFPFFEGKAPRSANQKTIHIAMAMPLGSIDTTFAKVHRRRENNEVGRSGTIPYLAERGAVRSWVLEARMQ